MRTSSAKAKGRRAVQELRESLLAAFPILQDDDIRVTPSGVTGEDLWLSPVARALLPFVFEVKNQESIQIWSALEQAEQHARGTSHTPVLAFKRNRSRMYVALSMDDFVDLIGKGVSTNEQQQKVRHEEDRQEVQVQVQE